MQKRLNSEDDPKQSKTDWSWASGAACRSFFWALQRCNRLCLPAPRSSRLQWKCKDHNIFLMAHSFMHATRTTCKEGNIPPKMIRAIYEDLWGCFLWNLLFWGHFQVSHLQLHQILWPKCSQSTITQPYALSIIPIVSRSMCSPIAKTIWTISLNIMPVHPCWKVGITDIPSPIISIPEKNEEWHFKLSPISACES